MRMCSIASGSSGNCIYIGDEDTHILIDAGISRKAIETGLKELELSGNDLDGIFITHEHSDHVKGLKMLTKKTGLPVFGQRETLEELISGEMIAPACEVYELDSPAAAADMEISCFDTPHDTVRSCGYRVKTSDGRVCAVCTDLGYVTDTVRDNLNGCNLVLLESNYDEKMLASGPYPYYLKERIRSKRGHLSNTDCSMQSAELIRQGTTHIILGHLSQENNTPYMADKIVETGLKEFCRNKDYILEVAPVETNGKMVVF